MITHGKHTNLEELHDNTCHPRSCFEFSSIADRNTLKDTEMRWFGVKEGQGEAQLLARFDRSDQVPIRIVHSIPYWRQSNRMIAAHRKTYAL